MTETKGHGIIGKDEEAKWQTDRQEASANDRLTKQEMEKASSEQKILMWLQNDIHVSERRDEQKYGNDFTILFHHRLIFFSFSLFPFLLLGQQPRENWFSFGKLPLLTFYRER